MVATLLVQNQYIGGIVVIVIDIDIVIVIVIVISSSNSRNSSKFYFLSGFFLQILP